MKPGLVSVVIPTYNRIKHLPATIESVLSQSYTQLEVIVVDDGSKDNTVEVITAKYGNNPKVRLIAQANGGVATARNAGMKAARGEFIALLDSDDLWLPYKLEVQVGILNSLPECGMIWSDMVAIDSQGVQLYPRFLRRMYQAYRFFPNNRDLFGTEHTLKEKLGNSVTGLADETLFYSGNIFSPMVLGSLVHTSTVMFRKTKMDEIGYLREDFKICEDYEYFLRITKSGPVAFVDCPTIEYRIGEEDALSAPKNAIVFSAVFLNMLRGNLRNETVSLPPGMIKQALSDAYAWVGNEKAAVDEHYMASKYLLMAVIHRPSTEKIKLLLVSLLPRSLRIWLKTFLKSKRKAHA